MSGEIDLFRVSHIHNGWIVTSGGVGIGESQRIQFCETWEAVEKECRDIAFPFPNKETPRLP